MADYLGYLGPISYGQGQMPPQMAPAAHGFLPQGGMSAPASSGASNATAILAQALMNQDPGWMNKKMFQPTAQDMGNSGVAGLAGGLVGMPE